MALAVYSNLAEFGLVEDTAYQVTAGLIVTAWGLPSKTFNQLNLNRSAPLVTSPGSYAAFSGRTPVLDRYYIGFKWQADDNDSPYWWPQGLTGNVDSDGQQTYGGKKWLLVGWYNKDDSPEKGIRVAFFDLTTWQDPIPYRHVLLVEPVEEGGHASFQEINIHAGGIAWYKNYLYVVDTYNGLRVFDLNLIKEVDTSLTTVMGYAGPGQYGAYGYRYVVPQLLKYTNTAATWSYCSIDCSQSTHYLVVGNYSTSVDTTKIAWFTLNGTNGKLSTSGNPILPNIARITTGSERYVQGTFSKRSAGYIWLAASGSDFLWRRGISSSANDAQYSPWADQPEGLTYSPFSDNLWNVAEQRYARAVFAVKLANVSV